MRVISGRAKGKKLFSPKNLTVRPTTDRIKESLFNIISPWIYESVFIDLFAGSGSMGIEAISRGAKEVYFFDNNRESIELIKKNLKHCNFADSGIVRESSYVKSLDFLEKSGKKCDVFFLDPPYNIENLESVVNSIYRRDLLNEDGIILLEHDITRNINLDLIEFECYDSRKFGNTGVLFFRNRVIE
ncbi:16S rRNA (guanine(966)-N(2))-methyltransferase RsmD [Alkalibacter mobilis]|uniref:16S rRNA (guanine(966)-N(2))-methyltransferase RsmD n=1 Tax=Alkalibacter mobilis TaxID=2787712 RepID=UPI00189EF362|nr:16S rRNA (guanine(966)-N(2))-methyltransferase RsmD [Alkalibacter mobilis]MBF7095846.1 16S rRNA (guanine(966)-N(2))-methyltransferase RsmD [Alkalibacter mobilis]